MLLAFKLFSWFILAEAEFVISYHARIKKVLSGGGGPTLTTFFVCLFVCFLVDEGRERIQIPLKAGYNRPASMTFCWRNDGGPRLNAGLVACDCSGDPDHYC